MEWKEQVWFDNYLTNITQFVDYDVVNIIFNHRRPSMTIIMCNLFEWHS